MIPMHPLKTFYELFLKYLLGSKMYALTSFILLQEQRKQNAYSIN